MGPETRMGLKMLARWLASPRSEVTALEIIPTPHLTKPRTLVVERAANLGPSPPGLAWHPQLFSSHTPGSARMAAMRSSHMVLSVQAFVMMGFFVRSRSFLPRDELVSEPGPRMTLR